MRPDSQKLLSDILDAANSVLEFCKGKEMADVKKSRLLRAGIYYEFVVIGGAISRLRQSDEQVVERISEYWRIVGFRNQIIHGYAKIDDEITWRIIQNKLPVLIDEVSRLLKE